MEKPYVISAELDSATAEYINKKNLENARESLDADLRAMGKTTQWVSSTDMRRAIAKSIDTRLPVVSLEESYVDAPDTRLGISRGVDSSLRDIGYISRSSSYAPLASQIDQVARLGNEIQVVDDVVFSGEMLEWLSMELRKRQVTIGRGVCGIAIQEGINKLEELSIPVQAGVVYDDVDDEICERDLFITKGSGRKVKGIGVSALYFDQIYGRPTTWASIPAKDEGWFCVNSLERSLTLLDPSVALSRVGSFLGYSSDDSTQQAIQKRLDQLQERGEV